MKKFLSLILALTLVASLFTVNVMAASKAHTITLAADKATELKAGDTVTVEVAIDNTDNIVSCGYVLSYDTDAFTIDTAKSKGLEKYIDATWYNAIKVGDWEAWWGYYLGAPVKNANTTDGTINFKWAGTYGIGADEDGDEHGEDDKVIGKFYLTLKDDVADGEYEISLTGDTMDAGENSKAAMVCDVLTVKVGAAEVLPENPTVGATTAVATNGVASEDGTKIYDNALAVNASVAPVAGTTAIGVLFAPKAWLGSNELVATLDGVANATKTGLLGVAASFTAAIKDIPRALNDTEFVMVTRAYAYDDVTYTYGDAAETTVKFTKTAE